MNLNGKTVVITGGTDGLGLSLAKELVAKKAKVVVLGKDQKKLDELGEKLGVKTYLADVGDYGQLEKAAKDIGPVESLINNAGIWLEGIVTENTPEEITKVIEVNLRGVIYATKAFLPKLYKADEAHIVNVVSTAGLKGRENFSVYSATKFGVAGFTDSLKADLEKTNIKVSGFYPGGMKTKMYEKVGIQRDTQNWMETDKVAKIIVFMLEQDETMVMDHVVLNRRK